MIKSVDINIIGHFGNTPTLEIMCDNLRIVAGYDNTKNIGYLLKALYSLFNIHEEDGMPVSRLTNIPCRLIFEGPRMFSRCIGFGHFMQDKFVYTRDFMQINA